MSFIITLLSSGQTFIAEENETILEAALRQGMGLPYGCRNGACGSCKGQLISGQIEYNEAPLSGLTAQDVASGMVLFCQAKPVSDITIKVRQISTAGDLPLRKLPCRVIKIEKLNHDVLRLYLKLPSTECLQFLAGQYIDILMPDGKHRSYSLANAPHDDENLELHVRHYEGGLFSEFAFHHLREKTLLRIEGPLGTFFLNETSDRPIIMVAGGTGFAPVKSIIEHAKHKQLQRQIYLYWGARSKEDLYLHDLACEWTEQISGFSYVPVLSEPKGSDHWDGLTGLVHEAVLNDFSHLTGHEVYACGPPPMVHAVRDTLIERGLPEDFIYSDSFEIAPKK
jgi:CDP-4-dehydro-6-deoxyglucose reductase